MTIRESLEKRLAAAMANPGRRDSIPSIDEWHQLMNKQFICDVRGFHSCALSIKYQEIVCMAKGFCVCVCGARYDVFTNHWTEK